MNVTECNAGDVVAVVWKDHHCEQPCGVPCQCRDDLYCSWLHNTEQLVVVMSPPKNHKVTPGKASPTAIVNLADPDTFEPVYRAQMHMLGTEVEVIEVVMPSKRVAVREGHGDISDPLANRMGGFKLEVQDNRPELETVGYVDTIAHKVEYVKKQGQTRAHHCHWPDCTADVPPAMWGCKKHWYMIPQKLRSWIWDTYKPGQERTGRPSSKYVEAAAAVQKWIEEYIAQKKVK